MYLSCSNASSWYVADRGGSGWNDWSYPNFQVLSRPVVGLTAIATTGSSHDEKKRGGRARSRAESEMEIWRHREMDDGTECGGSILSPSVVRPLIARPPCSPSLPPSLSVSPSSHLTLFLWRALAEKIFVNSWACRRCWGCLKPASLTAVCMGSAPDKALGSGMAYTIG